MSLLEEIRAWPAERIADLSAGVGPGDVAIALRRDDRRLRDLIALLSPHAVGHLETMAQEANRLTRWQFGRTMGLYVPLYVSNICGADCVYCGYSVRSGSKEWRGTLSPGQIERECDALAAQGFQHVLLLTGEAPNAVSPADLAAAVDIARTRFASVSVEVYAMDTDEYALLTDRGLEGVTLYMETYHEDTYADVHLLGRKTDYAYRLDAIERAGQAGVRRLSIGSLGLYDWRAEAVWLALHGRYLQKACWRSAISISFPRLRHVPDRYSIHHQVTDRELVQLMLAMRLVLPEAGINLSTREPAALRDQLIPLGVTMMSAGSSTRPGGYATHGEEALEQFAIEDQRSAAEVAEAIVRAGYDPVWKDFDHAFDAPDPLG